MRPTIHIPEFRQSDAVLLSPEERELLRSRFSRYLSVQPDWTPHHYRLAATHYVGTIEIGELRIRLEPKTPAPNLFYMLTYAYGLPELRKELTELLEGADVFEFVVSVFVKQVEDLLRKGIHRTYRVYEESFPYLRGRLMLQQQLRRELAAPGRFEQRMHEFTADILENRILVWTLHKLPRAGYRSPALPQRVRRASRALAEVTLTPIRDSDFDNLIFTRLNDSYRTPMRIAHLLLQWLSVESGEGAIPFNAWLLDMNQLFEQFVANYLSEYIADNPDLGRNWSLERHHVFPLDDLHSEEGDPDITLRHRDRPVAVLDTKHKVLDGKPEANDRRQMLEYCNAQGLSQAVLLYSGGATTRPLRSYVGTLPLKLHVVVWPLDGPLDLFRSGSDAVAGEIIGRFLPQPVASVP